MLFGQLEDTTVQEHAETGNFIQGSHPVHVQRIVTYNILKKKEVVYDSEGFKSPDGISTLKVFIT
jgi:hypothetical protein